MIAIGKTALITGAAGGVGSAITLRLAEDGFDVAVAYNSNADGAEQVAQQCREHGVRAVTVHADLADPQQVFAMFDTVLDRLDGLDVFVHNAASTAFAMLGKAPAADYTRAFAVNVDALYHSLGRIAKIMSDGGRVVTISSRNVDVALPGSAVYSATKAAAETLTKVGARELGSRGITCNSIRLGVVDTPTARAVIGEAAFDGIAQQSNVRRIGSPADVAGTVSYLVSADAAWLTGQTIKLDGGLGS